MLNEICVEVSAHCCGRFLYSIFFSPRVLNFFFLLLLLPSSILNRKTKTKTEYRMKKPNGGVIWFRKNKNDAFRKHTVTVEEPSTAILTPLTLKMFGGKTVVNLSKFLVQIIPSARVTLTRGRSSSPAGSRTAVASPPPESTPGKKGVAQRSEEDRFHDVESYVSFFPIGGQESERLHLRCRDNQDTCLWFQFFLHLCGRQQSMEQCYPFGNPTVPKPVTNKPDPSTGESPLGDKANESGAVGDANHEEDPESGKTTSSSASTTTTDDDNEQSERHKSHQRKRNSIDDGNKRTRAESVTFDSIPLVKATSVTMKSKRHGKQKKKGAADEPTSHDDNSPPPDFQLTLEEASSEDEASPRLIRRQKVSRPLLASTTAVRPHRWSHSDEDPGSPDDAYSHRVQFLERLWQRCAEGKDELVKVEKERAPLESDFGSAAISVQKSATGAYLFDQVDQRTVGTCKAAIQRNGIPVTVLAWKYAHASASHRAEENIAPELRFPSLALAHVDESAFRLEFASGKAAKFPSVAFERIVAIVPREDQKELPADDENECSIGGHSSFTSSSTPSLRKTVTLNSAMALRRLSPMLDEDDPKVDDREPTPTVDSSSLACAERVIRSPEQRTPVRTDSPRERRAGSLALVLPTSDEAALSTAATSKYLLDIYIRTDLSGVHYSSPLPIFDGASCVITVGFPFAVERKAFQRLLVEGHAKTIPVPIKPQPEDVADDDHKTRVGPGTPYLGVYTRLRKQNVAPCPTHCRTPMSNDGVLGSTKLQLLPEAMQGAQCLSSDLVLDHLAYDLVQVFLLSARRSF